MVTKLGELLQVAKKKNVDIWLKVDTFNALALTFAVTADEDGNLRLEYDGYVISLTLKSTLLGQVEKTSIQVTKIAENEKVLYTCKELPISMKTAEIV